MTPTPTQAALWANEVQRSCLLEAGDDVEAGLAAAEYILSTQPISDGLTKEVQAESPPNPDPPSSVFLAYDIHNRQAQGILNRALRAARGLSTLAKKDLAKALKQGERGSGGAILDFINKYRLQLANLLSATQLAALLEGASEVATGIPTLAAFPSAAPLPPSLEPKEVITLVNRLESLTEDKRAEAIYELPADQQTYVQQALAAKEASPPPVPPRFTPPPPPTGSPEEVHFPVIEEAVKQLSEKNVMTREKFDALDAASRAKAFTVAGVQAEETLTKIRDSLAENVKEGVDYETWRKKVLEDVDQSTFMSEGHMENVFRTTVQTQFSDGQETVLSHPLVRSGFPYRARDAIHDERVRENHLALEKMGIQGTNIYRANDPVWQLFRVPWDYNDRCSDTPVTVRQAAEAGINEAQQWLETGVEPSPPAYVPMPDFRPPPGFQRVVASAPLSIQLSMRSIDDFFTQPVDPGPAPAVSAPTFPNDPEEYPRNSSNQFVDPYTITKAAQDQDGAVQLRESLPEDQRPKLDRAISHLQSGGLIHHPNEPAGLSVNINGIIVDPAWAVYSTNVERYDNWKERQTCRDECRKSVEKATTAVRSGEKKLDEIDALIWNAGATSAEMRAVSRMRHLVSTEKREMEALEDLYENMIEAIHQRIDADCKKDPEPDKPEEPAPLNAAFAIRHAPAGYTRERPLIIGGMPFIGGEFIPDEAWVKATPEERARIEGVTQPLPPPPSLVWSKVNIDRLLAEVERRWRSRTPAKKIDEVEPESRVSRGEVRLIAKQIGLGDQLPIGDMNFDGAIRAMFDRLRREFPNEQWDKSKRPRPGMKKKDPREINALTNQYLRELRASDANIGSPYREGEYVRARLRGKTHEEAVEIARSGPKSKSGP